MLFFVKNVHFSIKKISIYIVLKKNTLYFVTVIGIETVYLNVNILNTKEWVGRWMKRNFDNDNNDFDILKVWGSSLNIIFLSRAMHPIAHIFYAKCIAI